MALQRYFIEQHLEKLVMSPAIRSHAQKLLALLDENNQINVEKIHLELFPLSTPASANSSLSRLLGEINKAAEAKGSKFSAQITPNKKAGAAQRWVWFEGPVVAPITAYSLDLNAIPRDQIITDQGSTPEPPAIVILTFNQHETNAAIRVFCGNQKPVNETIRGITYSIFGHIGGMKIIHRVSGQGNSEAQNSAYEAIQAWSPKAIIALGIAFGVNESKQHIGDVLVSKFIVPYELSRINSNGSITVRGSRPPASHVLVQRFEHLQHTNKSLPRLLLGSILTGDKLVDNLDYRESLKSIDGEAVGGEMEAFGLYKACQTHHVDWIVLKAICDWGDGYKNSATKEHDQQLAAQNAAIVLRAALEVGNLFDDGNSKYQLLVPDINTMYLKDLMDIPDGHLICDQRVKHANLDKEKHEEVTDPSQQQGSGILETLLNWAAQADGKPLFALLGEYGMGKTITCQRFLEALSERYSQDNSQPVPLYFDLRNVTGLDKRVPTLRETLEECMERGWLHQQNAPKYEIENVFRWIEQGAIVIIDGLDEVLVKLKEADGQIFTNNLLKLRKDVLARQKATGNTQAIKMLISCRTQYFRTLREQKNHFTGQERGETRADNYEARVLLPLSDEQIAKFLSAALPEMQVDKLLDTIRSVHNLEELTHRPYTLRLVSEFIPEIEQDRMAGKKVYGVTLYRRMAQRWLERDAGKHHIKPEHKTQLAAHLAAYLWQKGNGLLPANEIESWFHAWLEEQPTLKHRYKSVHPDQLEEDLRNSTFLSRKDSQSGSAFAFAHTSLMEFFLAEYLLQAIINNTPEHWAMKQPSNETLDFLGQMLAEKNQPQLIQTLSSWRKPYRPLCSELLLKYALRAHAKLWPQPILQGIDLSGAKLTDMVFEQNKKNQQKLNFIDANFSGADLKRSIFRNIPLQRANFNHAQLQQSNFIACDATASQWQHSTCTATVWHHCQLENSLWQGANGDSPQWVMCNPYAPSDGQVHHLQNIKLAPLRAIEHASLHSMVGHYDSGNACAWSSDSSRIVSAGGVGTVLIWDAASGAQLLSLEGHEDSVTSCAWSSDSCRIVSAGSDGTVRIWDAASGAQLLSLEGHENWVRSCAWSSDSSRIVSAGVDGTVRIWDAASGVQLLSLEGHEDSVNSCAWSSDSSRIVSAGDNGTMRIWDAASGAQLLSLEGHENWVLSCAWSSDSSRIVSAGNDGTVRIWDAASGAQLLSLEGHEDWVRSCAWSSDSSRIVSAGVDGTVRIWDAASGVQRLSLEGHEHSVNSCAWSSDSSRIVSAGDDGTVRIWDAESGEQLRCTYLGINVEDYAIWEPETNCITSSHGEIWRTLGWVGKDAEGKLTRYPLESFNYLPEKLGMDAS